MKRTTVTGWLTGGVLALAVVLALALTPTDNRSAMAATLGVALLLLALSAGLVILVQRLGAARDGRAGRPPEPQKRAQPAESPEQPMASSSPAAIPGLPAGVDLRRTEYYNFYRWLKPPTGLQGYEKLPPKPRRRGAPESRPVERLLRWFNEMTLARRFVLLTAISLAVIGIVVALVLPVTGPGLVLIFAAALSAIVDLVGNIRVRYIDALRKLAGERGFAFIAGPADEAGSGAVHELKVLYPPDIFPAKAGGRYPLLVGRVHGYLVTVRQPYAAVLPPGVAEATRVAVHLRVDLKALTIYDIDDAPPGFRYTPTGDAAFDRKFKVRAPDPAAMPAILGPEARVGLLHFDRAGLTGIEVGRYGVYYYERGLATDPAVLTEAIDLLTSLALNIPGNPDSKEG